MSKELNNSILRIIECPICFHHMSKVILGCVRGHNICEPCSRRVTNCPTCQRPIVITNRNYALEAIAELLYYPCPYADVGCVELVKTNETEEHRLSCSYRPYQCVLGRNKCQWEGTRFELSTHALRHHKENLTLSSRNSYCWKFGNPAHEVNMIKTFHEIFLFHRKLLKDEHGTKVMCWALQYVGKSEDKIQYNYRLRISSDEYRHRSMTFEEHCCDDLRTIDEILGDDFCVVVPLYQLETFQNTNSTVLYQLSIHKV